MSKIIFTSLFSFILLISIVAPTYISLTEGSCELTQIADFGEEEEPVKDLEVKIYYPTNSEFVFSDLQEKKGIRFYYKNYSFMLNKLNSPPPEKFLS
ncbi:MAG: hypothetical protein JKY02_04840 [Flavobacteriaceae bacterium]|nr:hypothetical protein [Flavobacteriaceae bacterium]